MVALNLASLVLNRVAVLRDSANVELRLVAGSKVSFGSPEIPFSMRHLSQGYPQEPESFGKPAGRQSHQPDGDADTGAGRSQSLAGVLSRSTPRTALGRTVLRRFGTNGGTTLTTACLSSLATTATAAGNEANSRMLVTSNVHTAASAPPVLCRSEIGEAWYLPACWQTCSMTSKPASRTPPASTWGHGIR